MTAAAIRGVIRQLGPSADPLSDADLLTAFAAKSDTDAFAALVTRHGPNVFGVCRRVLGDSHDAEDAFQAVFLVLAQKAASVRPPGSVGGWLYGVAVRTATKAKVTATRRRRREMIAAAQATRVYESPSSAEQDEWCSILDQELAKLPDTLRAAIVLCDLHGKTRTEAATELKCPEGTVAARLHRARKKLADALSRRGLAFPAVGLAATLTPALVPANATRSVHSLAIGTSSSPAVVALAREVIRSMATTANTLAFGILTLIAGGLIAATGGLWSREQVPSTVALVSTPETIPDRPADDKQVGRAFDDHKGYVYSVSYSPDGKQFLSVGNGKAIMWNAETQKKLFTLEAEWAAFTADGTRVSVLVGDEFRLCDMTTGKIEQKVPRLQPKQVYPGAAVGFAQDFTRYVEFDGIRHFLRDRRVGPPFPLADQADPYTGNMLIPSHGRGVDFSPDDKLIAGIHAATTDVKERACLSIWNIEGKRLGTISAGLTNAVQAFAWSPNGKELAVGYGDGVRIYDVATFKEVRALVDKKVSGTALQQTTAVNWSPDGKLLAVAVKVQQGTQLISDDGRVSSVIKNVIAVRLLDAATGKEISRFDGFPDNLPVVSLAFKPDGRQLIAAAGFFPGNGPAANAPQQQKDVPGLHVIPLDPPVKSAPTLARGYVSSIQFSPDGKQYAVVASGLVAIHDSATQKVMWTGAADAASFLPDGKSLIVMTGKAVAILDRTTGKATKEFPRPKINQGWNLVAFSPDGKRYAAHFGFNVRVYDTETGFEPIRLEEQHELGVNTLMGDTGKALFFSPDGKTVYAVGVLVAAGQLGSAGWSLETGTKCWAPRTNLKDLRQTAAFSTDGLSFAVGYKDHVKVRITPKDPENDWPVVGKVTSLAFSPDGKLLAVGVRKVIHNPANKEPPVLGYKSEVQLLDSATGKEVRRFDGFERDEGITELGVTSLAFSPDGKMLLAGTGISEQFSGNGPKMKAGEVKMWNVNGSPLKEKK